MNQQLEELFQKGAQYYTPSRTATIAPGESETLRYTGLNSRQYGVNRFIVGGTGLTDVVATAKFNNGKDTKFEDIQLATLRNLFINRSLRGAFIIDDSTDMYITLTNQGDEEHTVNIQLVGYDDVQLNKKKADYENRGIPFPKPEFVFANTEVPAGVTSKRLSVSLPAYPLRLYRIAVSSDDPSSVMVSLRQDQVRIKPETFLTQINDEFKNMDIILPQNLKANIPFDIFLRNTDTGNDHSFSFLAETYKI